MGHKTNTIRVVNRVITLCHAETPELLRLHRFYCFLQEAEGQESVKRHTAGASSCRIALVTGAASATPALSRPHRAALPAQPLTWCAAWQTSR